MSVRLAILRLGRRIRTDQRQPARPRGRCADRIDQLVRRAVEWKVVHRSGRVLCGLIAALRLREHDQSDSRIQLGEEAA